MVRSQWKLVCSDAWLKNVNNIHSKNLKISEKFVNSVVFIYNGRRLIPVEIVNEKIGLRFGELILTKKLGKTIHSFLLNKKKKNKWYIFLF